MSETMDVAAASSLVTDLEAAVDALIEHTVGQRLDASSDSELLQLWRRMETVTRRLAVVDHEIVNQVEHRRLAYDNACKTTADLARHVLRISPAEAKARVAGAVAAGTRRSFLGDPLERQFPIVAAAQHAGTISPRHAHIVAATVEALPDEVRDNLGDWVENHLVDHARSYDPTLLARHAHDLRDALDQDGILRDEQRRERGRHLDLHRRPDGSGHGSFDLTAEAAEYLQTMLDSLAKPAPATPAASDASTDSESPAGTPTASPVTAAMTPDPRTPGQRRHDALLEALKAAMRAGQLPNAGGVTATIILTMDADTFATSIASGKGSGGGTATTGHGYRVPAATAKRWAGINPDGTGGAETRLIAVLLTKAKAIAAYSSTHRIFTEQQRLALAARDRGCAFPGCDITAAWCETHHITEFQHSGHTRVDDGILLCGYNHRNFEAMGWTITMIDGYPWWTPPAFIDPQQRPIRNTMHDHHPE